MRMGSKRANWNEGSKRMKYPNSEIVIGCITLQGPYRIHHLAEYSEMKAQIRRWERYEYMGIILIGWVTALGWVCEEGGVR